MFQNSKGHPGKVQNQKTDIVITLRLHFRNNAPVELDKNYKAKWVIFDRTLYLYDVEILDSANKNPNKKKLLETFVGNKFQKKPELLAKFPQEVLFASWFSGNLYLKRQPVQGETYGDCMYQCESFRKISFKNGKVVGREEVSSMEVDIDSIEIVNNAWKYIINLNGISKNSNYLNSRHIKDRMSIEQNQILDDYFFGWTNDELLLNDSLFMCSGTPLLYFDNYSKMFPKLGISEVQESLPRFHDKNYFAKWTIINNMLYVIDIGFQRGEVEWLIGKNNRVLAFSPSPEENEMIKKEYTNRFNTFEKFVGRKFVKIPSYPQKVLFADWYSGTLYFKRLPARN